MCFLELPGYSYAPHYVQDLPGFEGLRLHYLDEGARADAPTWLCLHGQPTWSYLYRRMIPQFVNAGGRVIAPDLFGFGKSDKPVDAAFYTFSRHRDTLAELISHLDLNNVRLVCQDWGGLLGLTLPMDMPRRFTHLVVMNTALGTGDAPLTEGFIAWRNWCNNNPDMDIARLMARSCPHLSAAECRAYAAPFPAAEYKAGVRRFPNLVPDRPDADGAELSRRARAWWQTQWNGRTFMAVGMKDPVLGASVMQALAKLIRNCPPPYEHPHAGHFVQEWGEEIAQRVLDAFV